MQRQPMLSIAPGGEFIEHSARNRCSTML